MLIISLLVISACGTKQNTADKAKAIVSPVTYANTITAPELKSFLYTYASDDFQGREAGTEGEIKAVEFLKKEYQALDIPAAKADGDYFQTVPLIKSEYPDASIVLNDKTYKIGEDFVTFSIASNGSYQMSEIIFAGFGIDSEQYSDYKNIDVKGKLVLAKAGEPLAENGTYLISGTDQSSKWSDLNASFTDRIKAAKDNGATGLLFFDDQEFKALQEQYDFMKASAQSGHGRMQLKPDEEDSFFYFFINKNFAGTLFPSIQNQETPKTISTKLTVTINNKIDQLEAKNVAAIIKGVEKPDEYIIISSHLDHIGIDNDGQINNGADDDGSGTVAMLEIAEAFKTAVKQGNGPKRSVVFLHVSGEEKGLLGSKFYTDQDPIFPLKNTVANLNIDMIGRTDPKRTGNANYIYLIGSDKLSTELHQLSEATNKKYAQLELDYTYNDVNDPNRFYYRSDHYNFAKNNIPVIFYFNGTHADYHKPSDTPDKIEYELLTKRARLVFYTAWEIANKDKRLIVDKAIEKTQ